MATKISRTDLVTKFQTVVENGQISDNLKDRIRYTLDKYSKNPKSVSNAVLSELAKDTTDEINALLLVKKEVETTKVTKPVAETKKPVAKAKAPTKEKVPVEAKAKPTIKAKKPTEPKVKEVVDAPVGLTEEEIDEIVTPTKATKKVVTKKTKPEAETKAELMLLAEYDVDFPKTLTHEALGDLVAVPDKFTTMQEIRDYLNADKTLYIATYWNPQQIKKYRYAESYNISFTQKKFPHDMDILSTIVVCENVDRLWAMSVYSEAMIPFEGEDLVRLQDEKNRYSLNLEFEIYITKADADAEIEEKKPVKTVAKKTTKAKA